MLNGGKPIHPDDASKDAVWDLPLQHIETHDVLWGTANIPEYQLCISFPRYRHRGIKKYLHYKRLRLQLRLKRFKKKLPLFILWLANKIGDKNV